MFLRSHIDVRMVEQPEEPFRIRAAQVVVEGGEA
jgi:hypothetical protein